MSAGLLAVYGGGAAPHIAQSSPHRIKSALGQVEVLPVTLNLPPICRDAMAETCNGAAIFSNLLTPLTDQDFCFRYLISQTGQEPVKSRPGLDQLGLHRDEAAICSNVRTLSGGSHASFLPRRGGIVSPRTF